MTEPEPQERQLHEMDLGELFRLTQEQKGLPWARRKDAPERKDQIGDAADQQS